MKKVILLAAVALCTVAFSFHADETKTQATVNSVDGYLIFIQSKPVAPFETLGDVRARDQWSGSPKELFNNMLKNLKKDFPKADAVIIEDLEMKHGSAIKWK